MKFCTWYLWYMRIVKKNGSQKIAPSGGRHFEFQYGRQNHNTFGHISCSIAPRTEIQTSLPMFSVSRNMMAVLKSMSEVRHIEIQDGRQNKITFGLVLSPFFFYFTLELNLNNYSCVFCQKVIAYYHNLYQKSAKLKLRNNTLWGRHFEFQYGCRNQNTLYPYFHFYCT